MSHHRESTATRLILAVFALGMASSALAATHGQVNALLLLGWQPGPTARAALDHAYRETGNGDSHRLVDDAYLVALTKQHRYEDALRWLQDGHAVPQDDIFRGRTHVWLLLNTRRFEAALRRLEKLTAGPPQAPFPDWSPAQRGLPAFVGSAYGFLAGPGSAQVPAGRVDTSMQNSLAHWDDAAQTIAFDHRFRVLRQYENERHAIDELREASRQAQNQHKADQKVKLTRQAKQIDARAEALVAERDRLRKALRERLRDLAERDLELSERLAQMGLNADMLFDTVIQNEWKIQRLGCLYETEPDDRIAYWWLHEINQIDFWQAQNVRALNAVEWEASRAQIQRHGLRHRAVMTRDAFRQQDQDLRRERTRMIRWQQQLDQRHKKLERPATGMSTNARVRLRHLNALSTYEPFPFEAVRTYLLDRSARLKP